MTHQKAQGHFYGVLLGDFLDLGFDPTYFQGERNTFILLKWEQKPVEQNSQIVEGYREVGMMK